MGSPRKGPATSIALLKFVLFSLCTPNRVHSQTWWRNVNRCGLCLSADSVSCSRSDFQNSTSGGFGLRTKFGWKRNSWQGPKRATNVFRSQPRTRYSSLGGMLNRFCKGRVNIIECRGQLRTKKGGLMSMWFAFPPCARALFFYIPTFFRFEKKRKKKKRNQCFVNNHFGIYSEVSRKSTVN